jgi:hypothetical protein
MVMEDKGDLMQTLLHLPLYSSGLKTNEFSGLKHKKQRLQETFRVISVLCVRLTALRGQSQALWFGTADEIHKNSYVSIILERFVNHKKLFPK